MRNSIHPTKSFQFSVPITRDTKREFRVYTRRSGRSEDNEAVSSSSKKGTKESHQRFSSTGLGGAAWSMAAAALAIANVETLGKRNGGGSRPLFFESKWEQR